MYIKPLVALRSTAYKVFASQGKLSPSLQDVGTLEQCRSFHLSAGALSTVLEVRAIGTLPGLATFGAAAPCQGKQNRGYSTAPATMVRICQAFVLSFSRASVPADHRNPQNVHSIPLSTTNLSKIQESPLRFAKFKAFLALLLLPSLRIAETEQLETWIWTEVANI